MQNNSNANFFELRKKGSQGWVLQRRMGIKEESSWKTLKKKNDDYYGEHNEYPAEGKESKRIVARNEQ